MEDILKEIQTEIELALSAIETYAGFQQKPTADVDYYDKMILRTEGKIRGLEIAFGVIEDYVGQSTD